jgi:hypothetical protein
MMTSNDRIPAVLIVSGGTLATWQASALRRCADLLDVRCVLVAEGPERPRPDPRHLVYQLLRTSILRSAQERGTPLDASVRTEVPRIHFRPVPDGAWQRFPPELPAQLERCGAFVGIRFGMGLIRDPDSLGLEHGVLSFHHGDPARFKGRPAGFYELLEGEPVVGTIVQRLSNSLDGGRVLAIGWNRTVAHSYRRTMDRVYRDSGHVLRRALRSLLVGETLPHPSDGRTTRLPSNQIALRFIGDRAAAAIRHLLYGAFVRKAWTVGTLNHLDLARDGEHTVDIATTLPTPADARFVADPISTPDGEVLVEALHRGSGLGGIRRLDRAGASTAIQLPGVAGHVSYPFTFRHLGVDHLLPEMAQCGPQCAFALPRSGSLLGRRLEGLEQERLIDPTLHHDGSTWWLFAGQQGSEFDLLWLWFADGPFGPFTPHPANPVVHDPRRARPAGRLLQTTAGLLRPAQIGTGRYGDGLVLNRVIRLDRDAYAEEPFSSIRLATGRGPHTIDLHEDRMLVDAYEDRVSAFAAWDRIRQRLARRGARPRR